MVSTTKPTKTLNQAEADRSIRRIKQLLAEGMSQAEMCETLNREGYRTIRNLPWNALNLRQTLWKIRHQEKSWYGLSARRANLELGMAV